MRTKVLVIVFNLDRALEHEWYAHLMDRSKYDIHFALIRKGEGFLAGFLEKEGIPVYRFGYSGKKDLPYLTWSLFKLMKHGRFQIVHTHLFEASITGMVGAWMAGTQIRIVTRHHSDFHHVNSRLAVKLDRLVNLLATHIVAVSGNVQRILVDWESVKSDKITLIPHGIKLESFGRNAVSAERMADVRSRLKINNGIKVIGVVSRFIEWKGVQYIIQAFKILLEARPDTVLVLANALGPYKQHVLELLKDLPDSSYRLVEFENDMPALYLNFDCFVHVPISATSEAFGQTYIEALASCIPSVVTISGVALEYAKNEVNCLVVPYKDADAIAKAVGAVFDKRIDVDAMVEEGFKVAEKGYDYR
ncbi:MAG: glycosyltransferase family 4 protein, partial [Bacteroidota bacterium]